MAAEAKSEEIAGMGENLTKIWESHGPGLLRAIVDAEQAALTDLQEFASSDPDPFASVEDQIRRASYGASILGKFQVLQEIFDGSRPTTDEPSLQTDQTLLQ